jgi:hypothetical protein
MSRLRLLIALAVAATAAVLVAPNAAALAATPARASDASVLVLTVQAPQQPERHRVLRCGPTGGDHPYAAQACGELDRARGNPAAVPGEPRVCPYIYRPVTVTARGYWQGRLVDFAETYPNDCVLHARTGSLYEF